MSLQNSIVAATTWEHLQPKALELVPPNVFSSDSKQICLQDKLLKIVIVVHYEVTLWYMFINGWTYLWTRDDKKVGRVCKEYVEGRPDPSREHVQNFRSSRYHGQKTQVEISMHNAESATSSMSHLRLTLWKIITAFGSLHNRSETR